MNHPKRARAACGYWHQRGEEGKEGGCDQPILLGEFDSRLIAGRANGQVMIRFMEDWEESSRELSDALARRCVLAIEADN